MSTCTLGVDLGIRAAHVATLCDERGEVVWSKWRFRNRHSELRAVVDQIGDCDQLTVVMEPTRNAWVGIDICGEAPKLCTDEIVRAADVVITMGCGDTCPLFPGKRYEDWELTDPAGQPIEVVRLVRDDIEQRVRELMASLIEVPVTT